jgi:hypothetical protein
MRPNIQFKEISPRLVARRCGGWLAVTEATSIVRIGVEGETEEQARGLFSDALRRYQDDYEAAQSDWLSLARSMVGT